MRLTCPVCAETLSSSTDKRQLVCVTGHSFDRAKQGYWNLLLVQSKRSKDPGDNPEMVQARTRFLEAGHYLPVLEHLTSAVNRYLPHNAEIVDLGCGEGFYTSGLRQRRLQKGYDDSTLGLDISKHAIRTAAKRDQNITWTVGSSARIPVAENSIDLALIIFSRVLSEPLERVLKPGGFLIIAYPTTDHLMQLRELIYDEVREKLFEPEKHLSEAFKLQEILGEPFDIELKGSQQISDLLAMTPHGQRVKEEKRLNILTHESLITGVDIRLAVFRYLP